MVALTGSLYLVSTAAFAVLAIVIGFRLIALSRRTKRIPERSFGLALMLTAGLGYGTLMFALMGRQAAGGTDAPAYYTWLVAAGWIFHNLGVVFMLDFVQRVFRPEETWASVLKYALTIVLWGGWLADVFNGGLTNTRPGQYYWIAFAVIGTYPLWTAVEALRYWGLMRKRVSLGLSDPLVANRFLLWSIASICTLVSIWFVQLPTLLGYEYMSPAAEHVTSISMLCAAGFGILTIFTYWLTFFSPMWYRKSFHAWVAPEMDS